MKNEPIETHDPQLTAFALGEMTPSAQLQFERQLKESPAATAELAEIEETIGWLRDGFASELCSPRPMAAPLAKLGSTSDEKVVEGNFKRPGMRMMLTGLAAVLTGMLVVGSLLSDNGVSGDEVVEVAKITPDKVIVESAPVISDNVVHGAAASESPAPVGDVVLASYLKDGDDHFNGVRIPTLSLDQAPVPTPVVASQMPANPSSYLDYENMSATPILQIDPSKLTGGMGALPGLSALNSGKPSFGKYRFKNEGSEALPDDEFGHGNLSFEIRTSIVNGQVVEKIRLTDTRVNPDGSTHSSVKEFIREGSEVGKPIESLLNREMGAKGGAMKPAAATANPDAASLIVEFSKINAELEAVRDEIAKGPTGVKLVELELKLTALIKRQGALGKLMENQFSTSK